MGTHSWSVLPLGLLALFSAATQVSSTLPAVHFPNFHFIEVSEVSLYSARSLFSCIFSAPPSPSFYVFLEHSSNPLTPFFDFS